MIYIFEGMDNCLKDTLIQLFRSTLPPQTQILKYNSPPRGISNVELWQKAHFEDMFELLKTSLNNSQRNLILNRAHLGEYVYSPIYWGYEGDWIFDLEKLFLVVLIFISQESNYLFFTIQTILSFVWEKMERALVITILKIWTKRGALRNLVEPRSAISYMHQLVKMNLPRSQVLS